MAHFAQIDDSVVTQVIVVGNCDIGGCVGEDNVPAELWIAEDHSKCGDLDFPDTEVKGQKFIASLGIDGDWIQTSYGGNFRGVYAGIGFTYNSSLDVFIAPQPHPSWVLDKNGEWKAPIDMPDDGKMYDWNEEKQQWVESNFSS